MTGSYMKVALVLAMFGFLRAHHHFNVRLSGGSYGRVEVYDIGADPSIPANVGSVCDDQWDDNDCQVVCNQLGHSAGRAYSFAFYGASSGSMFLDEVACLGNETELEDCPHADWGDHNCVTTEDASCRCVDADCADEGFSCGVAGAVQCVSSDLLCDGVFLCDKDEDEEKCEYNVKLSGGHTGNVMVYPVNADPSTAGTVCDDAWDDSDCQVVCRELGKSGGSVITGTPDTSVEIYLDDVNCIGTETRLNDCPQKEWHRSNCNHNQDAACQCNQD